MTAIILIWKTTHEIKNNCKMFLQRKINTLLAPYTTTVTATIAITQREFTKWVLKAVASETTFNYTFNSNVYKNLDHCGNDSSIFHSKIYCRDKSSVRHSSSVFCILESMKETSKSALELWRQKRLDIVTYYSKQSKFLSYVLNEWINCIDAKLMSNKWVSLH